MRPQSFNFRRLRLDPPKACGVSRVPGPDSPYSASLRYHATLSGLAKGPLLTGAADATGFRHDTLIDIVLQSL